MGWTVLYIAFGGVALWLLGEVLLQYKARLRWRLLAFTGFLGVVIGVLLPSVFVIAAGAVAFAIGQIHVTLSFRRGFSTGWAIGGKPGESRRRKRGSGRVADQEPSLEVSDLAYEPVPQAEPVYAPEPLPDETGQYAVYNEAAYEATQARDDAFPGYDTAYSGYQQRDPQQHDIYAGQYDYPAGEQQFAAYSDPYIGTQQYGGQYDNGYGGQQGYDETPPGGVWVPQQRDGEQPFSGEQPPQEPYQNGYDSTGYNEQYRY
ncbi:hypothetical protein [Streptomyces sp. H27-C3]|uniref:hypothetical protein n=1 Tax=Streptomyces sp. H27-C3 TaxID=3046305 RepID=UPI0024BA1011|nr:hypothetical protein [Streptomyces sp. H27-C3]MDJ0461328.1 hypothetical protein [Streptomyces sp. H27-C3]